MAESVIFLQLWSGFMRRGAEVHGALTYRDKVKGEGKVVPALN
jgi:hypothetical protein